MHFDDDAIGSDGNRRARGGGNQAAASRGVRRIDHDGQVAKFLGERNAREVESVS